MLSSAQAAIVNNTIAGQLNEVGREGMPRSGNNGESYAWDYFIATKIEKFGKAKKEAAQKAAIKNGVMFDHEKSPRPPGTDEAIYSGDVVSIRCAVKNAASKVDVTKLRQLLISRGLVSGSTLDALIEQVTTKNREPHTFTCELHTG